MTPLTPDEERIFRELRNKKYRELMAKRRDIICYKCKTKLTEGATVCPVCGTKKRQFKPRLNKRKTVF